MSRISLLGFILIFGFDAYGNQLKSCATGAQKFSLAVHAGGGDWNRIPETQRKVRKAHLGQILKLGSEKLSAGMNAVDLVEFLISEMENSGKHNAGKGGKRNKAGMVELDASIMDGATMNSGAVAATKTVANPIRAARAVMDQSEHIFFVGKGAEDFASSKGIPKVGQEYFQNFFEVKKKSQSSDGVGKKYGTVGVAVLDKCGNLAAGTSTGGWNSKTPGRVGDSPLVGAGTYANEDLAISATGHGEYLIRYAAAHEIVAQYKYVTDGNLLKAGKNVVGDLKKKGGKAGFVTVDKNGVIGMPFNTVGMLRGFIKEDGSTEVKIFR